MKENKRRAAFRNGIRRSGRSGQGLGLRESVIVMTSAVRCVVWCLLNAFLSLWDLNPVSVAIRRWRKSQPKQACIAFSVRPRFRDLIGDWFLSCEGRKRKLLQWVHSMLPWLSDDVMDFGPSWQDGIVLCALMDTLNPGSCMQVHLLKPHHRVNNCRLGIQLAMTYLEITQATLSPEEMSLAEEGTEIKLVQLVQLLRWHFLKQGSKGKVESHAMSEEPVVAFKCEARGTGIKAGIVGKRTKFNLFVESVKHLHMSIEIKGPNNEYNKETIISMNPRGRFKYSNHNVTLTNTEDEGKAKVVEDGEGHSFLRQKSFDEGPSHLVIPFDYQCVGEGRFLATYIPRNAGLHYITILSHGNHIPGSPFEAKVSDWVSSWNLVPKGRVVPFDMINNYVEAGAKEGAKSQDKVRCKLSSVASVSKQLTTMRRRILKKVITQGGREIIVKQSGDIPFNASPKQDSVCQHRGGDGSAFKLPTIEEARKTHLQSCGGSMDKGKNVHNTTDVTLPSATSAIDSKKPPFAPPLSSTKNAMPGAMQRSDENNFMADFKNVKMDVSDKWKMAALKVSIKEMANKCDDSASSTNSDEVFHPTGGTAHNISIKITHCDSLPSDGNETCLDDSSDLSEEDNKDGKTDAEQNVKNACIFTDSSERHSFTDRKYHHFEKNTKPERKTIVEDSNVKNNDTLETNQQLNSIAPSTNSNCVASKFEKNPQNQDRDKEIPFQRWSYLRDNFMNYLQDFGSEESNLPACHVCNKELPSACTCCVDSGNESNPYCEETDGDESSVFGLDVDNVTESSIDSAMGPFQNYFQGQCQFDESEQQPMNLESKSSFGNAKTDRQQRSFISFRKERDMPGQDQIVKSDFCVNDFDNSGWKTLRRAQSFSDDFTSNEDKKMLRSRKRSQSFDSVDFDDMDSEQYDVAMRDTKDAEKYGHQKDNSRRSFRRDMDRLDKIPEETPKVSIVKDSNMVKSIFYIKAKRNDRNFRSYSLPENDSVNDNDTDNHLELDDGDNSKQTNIDTKRDRFALVKKAWKSFDAEILDLLSNNKEYIELNTERQNQPIKKKCAEISLKLVNENGGSYSSFDDNDGGDDENEEILEVVIDNNIVSDGFPSENEDDDESVIPTTPTSTRVESGLSSMKTSPINALSCPDGIRCQDCVETMDDARTVFGISPLSIEMNRSDNSDWSDDVTPEHSTSPSRQRLQLSRTFSPHIMDLPRFPASISPHRSPTITLSPSYNVMNSNVQSRFNEFRQVYANNAKASTNTTAQKPNPVEDSDVFTEDSSVSGSTSEDDTTVKNTIFLGSSCASLEEVSSKNVNSVDNSATNTHLMKSLGPLNTSSTTLLEQKPKVSMRIDRGTNGKIVLLSSGSSDDAKLCSCSSYHLKKKKLALKKDQELTNDNKSVSGKEICGCHCNCEMLPSNDHGCCLSRVRFDNRKLNSGQQFNDTCGFSLHERNVKCSPFVEKEIIPSKYKNAVSVKDSSMLPKIIVSHQKEFHWDMQSGTEPFVEKTLTPTKYRNKNESSSWKWNATKEKNQVKTDDNDIQSNHTAFQVNSNSSKHNHSFNPNDNNLAYQQFCESVLEDNTDDMLHSKTIENDASIWDSFSINDIEREANFIAFVYGMMMKQERSYFANEPKPDLCKTRFSHGDPVSLRPGQKPSSERTFHDPSQRSDNNTARQYKVLPRRTPMY